MAIIIQAPKSAVRLSAVHEQHLRIVFFGSPVFSVQTLRALVRQRWPIAAVVTAPDRPLGRKKIMTPSPVKTVASELGLLTETPETLKDEGFFSWFSNLKPDVCIVVAYNKILPQRYLDIPRLGFLNIHPSLLPKYRGPSPVRSAILEGDTTTGVSIMLLDHEMDHGPMLTQKPWNIPQGADGAFCEDELFRLGTSALLEVLPQYLDGSVEPTPQDHTQATSTKRFTREDGHLDWSQSAHAITNRIRALGDSPGTWTTWNDIVLNIIAGFAYDGAPVTGQPGTVIRQDDQLLVVCGDGALVVETVQLSGSTRQHARDFVNGHPDIIGIRLV